MDDNSVEERFAEQEARAEALVEQSAEDPLTIARTMHHLSMLPREMNGTILRLASRAADLTVDADAERARLIDALQEDGLQLTRARDRATYETREARRAAEQAHVIVDYAKRTQASVNRRHYELMNTNKVVDSETRSGGRR
jgi:uncharacterized coiled-coil protein SlyX